MHSADKTIQSLRDQLATLSAEATANEMILKRAQKRELSLLDADSLSGLFERLTMGLSDSFGVPESTVVLWDPDHEVRHLLSELSSNPLSDRVILVDQLEQFAPVYKGLRHTLLGPYEARYRNLFLGSDGIASVAILPLSREKNLMGSLNLGSGDPSRFTAKHATDFLEHLGVIASFSLENAVNRARLRLSGLIDVLTGWHNRRYLDVRLHEEVARTQRNRQTLSCLMIDIDHFKRVNDNHGHLAGDEVLRRVADRIATQVRGSDVAARFGGEEFVVLLPDADEREARNLAERIRRVVRATPLRVDDEHALTMTVSIGVAALRPGRSHELGTQGIALLDAADNAMYRAKNTGRDRVISAESVSIVNEID